jgi:hypothetical protein
VDQQGLAGLQRFRLEDVGEDGAKGLGQGGGLDEVEALGDEQGVAGVDDGAIRLATAAQQGADAVADSPAHGAVADLIPSPATSRPRMSEAPAGAG